MNETTVRFPAAGPPRWVNAMMRGLLRTPVLQHWLGRGLALLTFTGRRSGRRYTIPVSYHRDGDTVLVITRRCRNWWRNFATRPAVELRLAGDVVRGWATAGGYEVQQAEEVRTFLESHPVEARGYGLRRREDGTLDPADIRELLPLLVVVRIVLD